ncbi:hypothetical protein SAMN05444581_12422 [Methylocapsa palsarum]|uniref:Uncharacterized protein n=1 Tax=Methylocapsa palsarum TaxID=1612308 RepID=A0A1I4CNL2_9HYPH|nr:hypothetical protein SAMN05444581_12422 [Methylocapsa palsarum]
MFLNGRGCGVHQDRPLACRIYPLARWVSPEGEESFGHLAAHPQSAGVYGVGGKVIDYLEDQGLMPYFEMGDRYGPIYRRMVDMLHRFDAQANERRADFRRALDDMSEGSIGSPWLDVDAAVAAYCGAEGLSPPESVETTIKMHIEALGAWLDEMDAEDEPGKCEEQTDRN